MLTPEQWKEVGSQASKIYAQLELEIIEEIADRIASTNILNTVAYNDAMILQEMGVLYQDIITLVAKHNQTSASQIQEIFETAGIKSISYDDTIYKEAGLSPIPIKQSKSMLQLLQASATKTNANLENLVLTTANTSQTAFYNSMNKAYLEVTTGVKSYSSAILDAIEEVAKNNILVEYPSGYKTSIENACRMNIVTGVNQTCGKLQEMRAEEMDWDLMELTAHPGARPKHAVWQGQIVSRSGQKGYLSYDDIGYGTAGGFKGVNCRHDWYPYYEGSTRTYSNAELQELKERTVTYNGKKMTVYEASQLQRRMERQIRNDKKSISSLQGALKSGNKDLDLRKTAEKLEQSKISAKLHNNELNNFLKQTKLTKDATRLTIGKVTNSKKGVIILTDEEKSQITNYTRFDATRVNRAIRLNKVDSIIQSKIDILDVAVGKAPPLEKDIILHRGTIIQSFSGFENLNRVSHSEIMDLEKQIIEDRAFVSTSKLKAEEQGRNIIMTIKVPGGFEGALDIEDYATPKYKYQKEVLLKRNTRFYVKNIEYNEGNKKYYFDVEVIDE